MELLKKRVKKQGFEDSFFVIAVVFAICIFVLVMLYAFREIKTPLDEGITGALPNNSGVNVTRTLDTVDSTLILVGNLLPFILIGLFAFVLIGAAFYMNNPLMIVVGFIVLGVAILLAVIYSNVYHQISSADVFTDVNADLGLQELIMKYLPHIIFVMILGIIITVIWYRQGGSTGL